MARFSPYGAATLITLLGGVVLGVASAARVEVPEGPKVQDGTWQVAFERALDKDIAVREPSVELWASFEYLVFGEGRPGVLVGDDGWLYTDEEFILHEEAEERRAARITEIVAVQQSLKKSGVELIVALLPAKARVTPEHLGRYRFPDHAQPVYEDFRAALNDAGVPAPDLLPPLMAAKAEGPVFLRTDTHWTPAGARAVAAALAAHVAAKGPSLRGQGDWRYHPGATITHDGDLLSFIPLGPLAYLGPEPDEVQLGEVVLEGGGGAGGLFDEVTIPVTVTGSSYTDQPQWDFPGALRAALGVDVLEAAAEGEGPFVPMLDYLKDDSFSQSPPQLVIWEIPERFLSVEYAKEELDWMPETP